MHDEETSTFTIAQIEDLTLANTYTVTIKSDVLIADDTNVSVSPLEISKEQSFNIVVSGPCIETEFEEFALADMTYLVQTLPETQTLGDVIDSVSRRLGNQDGLTYCGPRLYSFTPSLTSLPFITFSNGDIVLQTDDASLISEYDFTVKISLELYPEVERQTTFHVSVQICKVTALTPVALDV